MINMMRKMCSSLVYRYIIKWITWSWKHFAVTQNACKADIKHFTCNAICYGSTIREVSSGQQLSEVWSRFLSLVEQGLSKWNGALHVQSVLSLSNWWPHKILCTVPHTDTQHWVNIPSMLNHGMSLRPPLWLLFISYAVVGRDNACEP